MFVVISGYLFAMQIVAGKVKDFKYMLVGKAKRILLPFFIFTIIFSITYSGWSWAPFYKWTYWHLWFLPMLFWFFVISYPLHTKLLLGRPAYLLTACVATFLLSLSDRFVPMVIGLHNIPIWLFWFIIGFALFRWEDKIIGVISRYHLVVPMILVYTGIAYIFPTEYGNRTWYSQLASLFAIIAAWYLVRQVDWQKYRITKYMLWLSGYSFGIYILHNWIAVYLVSTTAQKYLPIAQYAENHIILFPLILSIIVIGISVVFSTVLRCNKYTRNLI